MKDKPVINKRSREIMTEDGGSKMSFIQRS